MRIAIIGGSVAGLESAIQLSGDHDVTLFEEHDRIGYPLRCAEGWVSAVVKPYIKGREIECLVFRRLDSNLNVKESVKIRTNGIIYTIDRPKMEQKMAEMAKSKGCKIITGRRVTIKELAGKFDLIVDASGYPSQWCREFGGKRKAGVAVQAIVEDDFDYAYIDFIPKLDGYVWIFPKAKGGANIGIGFYKHKPNKPLKQILMEYLRKLDVKPVEWTAGLLGMDLNKPFVRQYNGTPVCLVGDAAGLVDPFFGEGMTKAIVSARILAECIREGKIDEYERKYMRKMRWHYLISQILYGMRKVSPTMLFKVLKLFATISFFWAKR